MELQQSLAAAVGRLSQIRKIRKKVKSHGTELYQRSLMEMDRENELLSMLDGHEKGMVGELRSIGVSEDADWTSFGLGDDLAFVGSLSQGDVVETRRASPDIPSNA